MRFSASSLFITLCISFLLILLLDILLSYKKSYKLFRTDFITVLIVVVVARMFVPLEFKFTKTIELTHSGECGLFLYSLVLLLLFILS